MSFTKETAAAAAKKDLSARLGVSEHDVREVSVSETDFPDMSLGAAVGGEMSAQMISSGWSITLQAKGKTHEYRADKHQLRLHNFKGRNYVIKQ
jgi:hypothetical protein